MNLKERLLYLLPCGEKVLKTVWRLDKDGTVNYLVGTAHFYPCRFARSIERLLRKGTRVFFEGPLDPDSQKQVIVLGSRGEGSAAIYDALDEATLRKIRKKLGERFRQVERPAFLPFESFEPREHDPLYQHFRSFRPWLAFFSLWTHYLRERGWKNSVDVEAWQIAGRMGKEIRYLETIEEQVAAMEKIPVERIIDFLKRVDHWDEYARAHMKVYLEGTIGSIMAQSDEFPSRCAAIVQDRDPVMFERLLPSFREGGTIAFVGTAHIIGLRKLLEAGGYRIEQITEPEG